jgi:putative addiction module component (TIGR02574 family)
LPRPLDWSGGLGYEEHDGYEHASELPVSRVLSRAAIAQLSTNERLELIEELTESLDGDQLALTPAQSAELDRRMETFERDAAEGVTWEVLRARLVHRTK